MAHGDPIAWFITWTVYGTHVQGAATGWRKFGMGNQPSQPKLESWHQDRLNHDVLTLTPEHRALVEVEVTRHCVHRSWTLWICNARSNHVHAVVTAVDLSGKLIRDQLKANATRGLREMWPIFRDRPVWTIGGDWKALNSEEAVHDAIQYVRDAQDRKGRDKE